MLPVSGAWQLIASGAMTGDQPEISATAAYSRLDSPDRLGQEQVPQAAAPRLGLELLHDRRVGVRRRARAGSSAQTGSAGKTCSRMKSHIRAHGVLGLRRQREVHGRPPRGASVVSVGCQLRPGRRPRSGGPRRRGRRSPGRPSRRRRTRACDALGDDGELEVREGHVEGQVGEVDARSVRRTARRACVAVREAGLRRHARASAAERLAGLAPVEQQRAEVGRAGRRAWRAPSPAPRRPGPGRSASSRQLSSR